MACGFCCVVQCAIALLCSSSPLGFQCPVSLCGLMGSFGLRVRVCVCVCGGGGLEKWRVSLFLISKYWQVCLCTCVSLPHCLLRTTARKILMSSWVTTQRSCSPVPHPNRSSLLLKVASARVPLWLSLVMAWTILLHWRKLTLVCQKNGLYWTIRSRHSSSDSVRPLEWDPSDLNVCLNFSPSCVAFPFQLQPVYQCVSSPYFIPTK